MFNVGGTIIIHDFHPFMNMLPLPGDKEFDSENLNRVMFNYFRSDPWIKESGIGHMTSEYNSKTFTSFLHTISSIINSLINNYLEIQKIDEFNQDVGLTDVYNSRGYTLAFLVVAKKK